MLRIGLLIFALVSAGTVSVRAADISDEIIYFVMVDRFSDGDVNNNLDVDLDNPLAFQGGDLVGLTGQLDEISSLGATMIWITPVALQIGAPIFSEFGDFTTGKGDFYPHHGYWAKDLGQIDPRYGSEEDLKALVDGAHDRGMKVILDVVYNHLGYGMEHDPTFAKWLRYGDECSGSDPIISCLAGLPDFKTELPEVREYLFETQLGLAQRVGLDGFRLDTVRHVTHDFWQAHRDLVDARLGEDFLLLGEVWDGDRFVARKYFADDEMDGLFDFSFRDRVIKLVSGVYDAAKFGRYLDKRHDIAGGYSLAPFLSNHDMPMLLSMFGGDKRALSMAATILLTIEGPPVIPYGEEIGRRGGIWPDNRQVMAWGERDIMPGAGIARDENLRDVFVDLIALRKQFPELRGDAFEVIYSDDDVLAYMRGQDVLVVINRHKTQSSVQFDMPRQNYWALLFSSTGEVLEEYQEGTFEFPPRSAWVFLRDGVSACGMSRNC